MRNLKLLVLASFIATGLFVNSYAQDAASPATSETDTQRPPELTHVTGRLLYAKDDPATAGVAFFVYQRRLIELPHDNTMDAVRAKAETSVAVDKDGSFTLDMAPGNYAMVFDPTAASDDTIGKPGPESMAASKKLTPDKLRERIQFIRDNGQKGLPIKDGRIGDAFVLENRQIRPPIIEFGELILAEPHTVMVTAQGADKKPIDFPATLRLRGKNGDIYEPHPPTSTDPGVYIFEDVFPQSYQVFALGSRPKPEAGDEITTPTVENDVFLFAGEPVQHTVKLSPGKPGGQDETPPPTPEGAKAKSSKTTKSSKTKSSR